MNNEPLVSAIIIILNAEKYLEEAIESVLAQTYQKWELLLCDDGSTDDSTQIVQRYIEEYPAKIRYLEHQGHQNRGMSATRNLGIEHAKGEYISWLDADDVWRPQKLERQVQLIGENPEAAMVYGPLQLWYSWKGDLCKTSLFARFLSQTKILILEILNVFLRLKLSLSSNSNKNMQFSKVSTGKSQDAGRDFLQDIGVPPNRLLQPPQLLIHFLQDDRYIPSGVLVRRAVLDEVGGYEESFRGEYEDVIVHAKICLKWSVFASGECWYKYRQHEDSCCVKTSSSANKRFRLRFLHWLTDYLCEQGFKDTEVWQVLQRELWSYRHPHLHRLSRRSQHLVGKIMQLLKRIARRTLPVTVRRWLQVRKERLGCHPPVGRVQLGSLRRLQPISRVFGSDRGLSIDRYYIENFLDRHTDDIQGHILEIGSAAYTGRFGGKRVTKSDVLHVVEDNPEATIVADLTNADHISSDTFDCVILTQTLQVIFDVRAALKTVYRILKPGGVVLVTFPGISQISRYDMDRWGYYWSFTTRAAHRLFEEVFPRPNVGVEAYGNVLTAIALLHGLATQELRKEELDYRDPDYEVIITVKAVKPEVRL